MKKIVGWVEDNLALAIGLGIGVVVVATIILLFVLLYEKPLDSGTVVDVQMTSDRVSFRQAEENHYRNVTKTRTVTKYRTGANGNRTSYLDTETYTDRVFNHHEYVIYRDFNGKDYVVIIEAPSRKKRNKMLSAMIYITADRYESVKNTKGQLLYSTSRLAISDTTSTILRKKWIGSGT